MKKGASDPDNLNVLDVPGDARKRGLYVQNIVVEPKFLVLIVPCRVNSTQLRDTR